MKDLQIIVVAPTGRDGGLICNLLARIGLQASEFPDCKTACREAGNGVGAFVIADEVLTPASAATLATFVGREPSWSDLPVIVLTQGGQVTDVSSARARVHEPLGNVILIERPVRPETLVSMVRSAIRARTRQYEVRDHLLVEKAASEALRKSEKLAIVGRLAATIAHEINNPLTAVTNLHYLMASCTSLAEAKRLLAIADEELARVIEITTQTLRFHRESKHPVKVNMAELLDSVLKLYARRIASSEIVVDRFIATSAPLVGFAGELRQLIANLVSNAVDSMQGGGGKLRVRLLQASEHCNGLRSGIRVVVADTGEGIPAIVRDNLFEPFVTTKADTGSGLGLWVSSEIVRKHSGSLRYRSRLGSGTVFSVFLPLQPSAHSSESAAQELVA
jgi:signal transduction histidine kinase